MGVMDQVNTINSVGRLYVEYSIQTSGDYISRPNFHYSRVLVKVLFYLFVFLCLSGVQDLFGCAFNQLSFCSSVGKKPRAKTYTTVVLMVT